MKRDMDLLRDLLLHIEKTTDRNLFFVGDFYNFGEVDPKVVEDHIRLLISADFIYHHPVLAGIDSRGRPASSYELTWTGYEFLDSVRDPEVWRKTKLVARNAGGWSLEILSETAKTILTSTIKSVLQGA